MVQCKYFYFSLCVAHFARCFCNNERWIACDGEISNEQFVCNRSIWSYWFGLKRRYASMASNFFSKFSTNVTSGAIHHSAWIDDFGKAKTYALERSRESGCDRIVFLDAGFLSESLKFHIFCENVHSLSFKQSTFIYNNDTDEATPATVTNPSDVIGTINGLTPTGNPTLAVIMTVWARQTMCAAPRTRPCELSDRRR